MRQPFTSEHNLDGNGNPAGGHSESVGLKVEWQNGPLGRGAERQEPNGAFVETLLAVALDRIQFYQTASNGKFQCRQNALAITKIEEALHWLKDRTEERERRQVEGTHGK